MSVSLVSHALEVSNLSYAGRGAAAMASGRGGRGGRGRGAAWGRSAPARQRRPTAKAAALALDGGIVKQRGRSRGGAGLLAKASRRGTGLAEAEG